MLLFSYMVYSFLSGRDIYSPRFRPIDEDRLDEIRDLRRRESEMFAILAELLLYSAFMIALLVASLHGAGAGGFTGFQMQDGIVENFVRRADFDKIRCG